MIDPDDLLDGCDLPRDESPTADDDIPLLILFARVLDLRDRRLVEARRDGWRVLARTQEDPWESTPTSR